MNTPYCIEAEELAYWYFRLNGCLTIRNFVVHPDEGIDQGTDIDIIAVRFPHRAELTPAMLDHKDIFKDCTVIRIMLAEVTKGRCKLNNTWLDRDNKIMQRVLRAIGAFPLNKIEKVSGRLYDTRSYKDSKFHISLFCLGKCVNHTIRRDYPDVPQIKWDEVLHFIYERFRKYPEQKGRHPQWGNVGSSLWDLAMGHSNADDFTKSILIYQS